MMLGAYFMGRVSWPIFPLTGSHYAGPLNRSRYCRPMRARRYHAGIGFEGFRIIWYILLESLVLIEKYYRMEACLLWSVTFDEYSIDLVCSSIKGVVLHPAAWHHEETMPTANRWTICWCVVRFEDWERYCLLRSLTLVVAKPFTSLKHYSSPAPSSRLCHKQRLLYL